MKNTKAIIGLHGMLMLYSLSSICGKLAAGFPFLSMGFIVCYGGMIALLGIYALGWQQVIKRLPLTFAYANRAVTVVWGIVWGALFFSEPVTAGKLVGALIVLAGVVLYATSGDDTEGTESSADAGAAPAVDAATAGAVHSEQMAGDAAERSARSAKGGAA